MAETVEVPQYEAEEDDMAIIEKDAAASAAGSGKRSQANPVKREPSGFLSQHPVARWLLLVLAVVLVVASVFVWRFYSVRESTDDAQVDGHIDPVSARVSGTVVKVLVDDNQQVSAGSPMVELDSRDYDIAVLRARADLAEAQANAAAANVTVPLTTTTSSSELSAANANSDASQKDVDLARARVQEAQANYTRAANDLKRMDLLIKKDEISQQQYDNTASTAAAARAALDAANSAVAAAQGRAAQAKAQAVSAGTGPEQIKVTRARASSAQAQVEKFRAVLAQAELNLQYTHITAPVNGIVSKRNVEPGQVIQAGQPLFAVVNLDDIYVTANFKETQLRDMKPGQRVSIQVDAYSRDYTGTVESIGGATGSRFSVLPPENATGNYVKVVQRVPVRIRIDQGQDAARVLRPGMSVTPTIYLK